MHTPSVVIIGAGTGGLAAALRLAHAGLQVTVLETHARPGGKMRTVPSETGPIDAGPTVLTMRDVFDDLFESVGENLSDHLALEPLSVIARHHWSDGTSLDLSAHHDESLAAVGSALGSKAAKEFALFSDRAKRLFTAFDAPMMRETAPKPLRIAQSVMRKPLLIRDMAPHRSLHQLLRQSFTDPKLVQLFGRYATYVGGIPQASPAILSLIWHAEAMGVWSVKGGMHQVAQKIEALAKERGAVFHYNTQAKRLVQQSGRISAVETENARFAADCVLFNGDPRALETGLLGKPAQRAVAAEGTSPRSLSAHVAAFAATYVGPALAHHTVFFADDEQQEFSALAKGQMPRDATLYICAQDHPAPPQTPQRFEIIRNAPPGLVQTEKEKAQCQTLIFDCLAQFGLRFDPQPGPAALTTPADFDRMFPASQGSLYGRSPHGMMAAFKRPTARTSIPGLYLCGGGAHPGAGVPMATLSGQHAAAAIMQDHASTSTSRQTATRGGMSTA